MKRTAYTVSSFGANEAFERHFSSSSYTIIPLNDRIDHGAEALLLGLLAVWLSVGLRPEMDCVI